MNDKGPPQPETAIFYLGDSSQKLDLIDSGTVDLVISSPPYNIGKNYERENTSFDEYIALQKVIAEKVVSKLKDSGSLCWQVGNHVRESELFPLDYAFYDIFKALGLRLKNRIIWKFNFGLNADRRFSGRYETLLWFVKGDNPTFNLDPVRIPQLYPGKRHSKNKGAKSGLPSGNPKGKNPSDYWEFDAAKHLEEELVWDIPNVKAKHPEKTTHTCQFPLELVERCVLALTNEGDTVLDPFVGTGTSVIAAIKHKRLGIGIEKEPDFLAIARQRVQAFHANELPMREFGKSVRRPRPNERVSQVPEEWLAYAPVEESGGAPGNGTGHQTKGQSKEAQKAEEAAEVCG